MTSVAILVLVGAIMFCVFGGVLLISHRYSLNIKSKTVGNGQFGTARWATKSEIGKTYKRVLFEPDRWRTVSRLLMHKRIEKNTLELPQGIVVGCESKRGKTYALVDDGDVHVLMVAAAGSGKTAYWLYPNIEYSLASGISFLTTDTKGDILRNYGAIARDYYGYNISVLDLRNPTRSNGNNLMHLINKYMDKYLLEPSDIASKAKAEKYAKVLSKTIIMFGTESASFGQNAFFYDSAEGLVSSVILLLAEFGSEKERHIVSVFTLLQELLAPSQIEGKTQLQLLMDKLPPNHKAKWFAAAALTAADQSLQSVISTALSRLNAFLDSELEQLLCFDTEIDAEKFCTEKSAIFVIMPEEDPNKYFMVSLFIQNMYREILTVADEMGGVLKNRCIFFCDEFGTYPKIESAELMFSASRSRRLQIVPIIQSLSQLEKNYGKDGADIIIDNTQVTIFGGFAPTSTSAKVFSENLDKRTVMSGSVSLGKNDPSQSLQMTSRELMSTQELKSMPKGQFIVMKTGAYPMKTKLKLFTKWGIRFDKSYQTEEKNVMSVRYASKASIERKIEQKYRICRRAEPKHFAEADDSGNVFPAMPPLEKMPTVSETAKIPENKKEKEKSSQKTGLQLAPHKEQQANTH